MKKDKINGTGGIREIARRANVAIATVDRVLHNREGVSEKTRKKINAIIKEMDYQPNILARRLASKRVYHFATLIPKVSKETDFWKAPLKGVERAETEIEQYGVKVLKYFFDLNSKASFVEQADLLLKTKIDGILMAPSFIEESIQVTNACKELKIPYVFINSDIPEQDNLCYIGPHLFQSGYLAAHLMKHAVDDDDKILVVNISSEIDNHHHLLRKEEGFRAYYKDNKKNNEIMKVDIRKTDFPSVEKTLSDILDNHPGIKAMFATNSRVTAVARFLEKAEIRKPLLVGYDFLKENINYLKKGTIDFLICQKPEEQGYKGIMALHQRLILNLPIEKVNYMPIDIVTKENYVFYRN